MPEFTVFKIQNALNDAGKPGARVHVLGVAYKNDIDDVRESQGAGRHSPSEPPRRTHIDPHVPELRVDGLMLAGQPLLPAAAYADCVVIVTNHSAFDDDGLLREAKLTVDTRNALGTANCANVVLCKAGALGSAVGD